MAGFLTKDFLLSNDVARRLYHQFAASQPILDYHCHLSPRDIAENRRFADLFEIWLEGDHYKWRATSFERRKSLVRKPAMGAISNTVGNAECRPGIQAMNHISSAMP